MLCYVMLCYVFAHQTSAAHRLWTGSLGVDLSFSKNPSPAASVCSALSMATSIQTIKTPTKNAVLHATRMCCGLHEANFASKIESERYPANFAGPKALETKTNGNSWHLLAIFHARPYMAMTVCSHAGEIRVVMILQLALPRLEFNALKLRQTKQGDGTACCSLSWLSCPNPVAGKHQGDVI